MREEIYVYFMIILLQELFIKELVLGILVNGICADQTKKSSMDSSELFWGESLTGWSI